MTAETPGEDAEATDGYRWDWLEFLPVEDRSTFITDVDAAFEKAFTTGRYAVVAEVISDWRETARALNEPTSRDFLLGTNDPRDFIEVTRPE